jgi:hypothetical protein
MEKNELSQTKIEQLQRQPIIETTISKTKDGKWVVFKTTITDIKPVKYYEKVLGNSEGS